MPAAAVAVGALGVVGGERVLDVACGTGNAARVAHEAGAGVPGIDPSSRLVGVARERVPQGTFLVGDAGELPFDDGAFDAAVSVFGVIFARPAERAAAEIARVVGPRGALAVTSWPAPGPGVAAGVVVRAGGAGGSPPPPPR